MAECNIIFKPMEILKFHGCDGMPWDDEFLNFHLQKAIKEEDYEWAAECRDEIKRRNNLKK